jgi:hypothetical protein
MSRWVLLLHELPDHSWHYDWMIQPAGAGAGARLISFRVSVRPDDPVVTEFAAERIGDHRHEYLSFEGAVSGNRGTVRRVSDGGAAIVRDDEEFVVTLDGLRTWVGQRRELESPLYHFHVSNGHLSNGPEIGHTGQ